MDKIFTENVNIIKYQVKWLTRTVVYSYGCIVTNSQDVIVIHITGTGSLFI